MEFNCPFCKIELQVYFRVGVFYSYKDNLFCYECGYIFFKDDCYVLTPNGYVEKPSKHVFNPALHFEKKKLNLILGNKIPKSNVKKNKQKNIHEVSVEDVRKIL